MTKEILESFKAIGDRLEDLNRRICDMAGGMRKTSTDRLDTQAGGISDLGDAAGDSAGAIDDLAATVAELVEKVSALEEKEAK